MTPERYQQICDLARAARDLEIGRRPAFLADACAGDAELRHEVESFVLHAERAEGFLEDGAMQGLARGIAEEEPTRQFENGNAAAPNLPTELNAQPAAARALETTLSGRYLIVRQIGEGGLGEVFLAHDQKLHGAKVVIKVLKAELCLGAQGSWFEKKFQHEIKALARIDHPGVVRALDTGLLSDGRAYLVMQYISGVPLRSLVSAQGMELGRVARLIRQIAQALAAAHEQGVIHRDLKPENIMVQIAGDEEYAKLIDFGIASVHESLASPADTTRIAGTTGYMAPEQLQGKPVIASDIYALGVIAYEMVTGIRPFNPDSIFQLLDLQREGVKVAPQALRPDLPDEAQAIILCALSFASAERPAGAREFGEVLARALVLENSAEPQLDAPPITAVAEVVLSFGESDHARVLALVEQLKAAGVTCWLARGEAEGDARASAEAEARIKDCKVLLLACSNSAIRSSRVKQEMQSAWKHARPYLPLLIEPISFAEQVAYWLAGGRWIEAAGREPTDYLPQLLQSLALAGVRCSPPEVTAQNPPPIQPMQFAPGLGGLHAVARFTDQIWPLPAERARQHAAGSRFRGLGAPQDDVQHGHRLGSRVTLAVEAERKGYLLLLDEGPEGITYCLCPSWFAQDTKLLAGRNFLPQAGARYDSFVVTGAPGREHLLALINSRPWEMDWMPADPRQPARVVTPADIEALCARLRQMPTDEWVAFSTYFDVIA